MTNKEDTEQKIFTRDELIVMSPKEFRKNEKIILEQIFKGLIK